MRIHSHHQFMMNFTKAFLLGLKRPVFVYLTSMSFTLILLASMIFYFLENGSNPRVETYFDAVYFSVTVMTGVGLGDIAPVTVAGKAASMIMMLSGTAIFVCFTAALSASILEIEMRDFKQ